MSGLVLAIETSTAEGSIALGRDGQPVGELEIGAGTRQSESLLPAIAQLMKIHSIERRQLSAVSIGGGPGSFTGLRIAAATAKGFVHALQLPLYAYSGLLAAAAPFAHCGRVCALFDARRDEVYAACVTFGETIAYDLGPSAISIHELLLRIRADEYVFVGEGAARHEEIISGAGGSVTPAAPQASGLLWLQSRYPDAGRVADPAHWEPDYLRASAAERGISA